VYHIINKGGKKYEEILRRFKERTWIKKYE
jgi:hypothetical protein